jgi:hypothetical protein
MDYFSGSTPDRQEPNHEPVTIPAGDHILHAVREMYDAHTLREMADAFRRIADEKEGIG